MNRPLLAMALACAHLVPAQRDAAAQSAPRGRTLRAFADEAEITAFHARMQREREQWLARHPSEPVQGEMMYWQFMPPPDPPPGTPNQRFERLGRGPAYNRVSPAQETGGDERSITAVHGDYLIVLRRGRLFTFRVGGGALQPGSSVDAHGPYIDDMVAYHDEILVLGDRVVVIGTSERLGGTEVGVFDLAPDGRLRHRATYFTATTDIHLASHTYAARAAGGRLVFYAPLRVMHQAVLQRWTRGRPAVQAAVPATRVYHPAQPVSWRDPLVQHTVMVCDPSGDELSCQATSLYATPGRVFHLSPTAVYVWTLLAGDAPRHSVLYRMPLDGSAPTAIRVSGEPVDPFSFLESGDGFLNVLVRRDALLDAGQEPTGPSYAGEPLALLRLPLAEMGDGSRAAAPEWYRPIPAPGTGALRNRFVGDWLIYSGAQDSTFASRVYAVRWAEPGVASQVTLPHGVARIAAMGSGAVVVGSDGYGVHLSSLSLGPRSVEPADHHALLGQTEARGFFYHATGGDVGVLALPIGEHANPPGMPEFHGPDRLHLLRNDNLRLVEMGELAAGEPSGDDYCRTGCGHWYRDTRPLFAGGRTLALLGYELVEAREDSGGLRPLRRVHFTPPPPVAAIAGDWTFYRTIGPQGNTYFCADQGTLRLQRDSSALSLRYQQDGACSDREGSATVAARGGDVGFEANGCRYTGRMASAHYIVGEVRCRVPTPDGPAREVSGFWSAWRIVP